MNVKQVECSPKDGCHMLIQFKQYVIDAIGKMITRKGLWMGVLSIIGTIIIACGSLFYFFDDMRASAKAMPDIKQKVDRMWVETNDIPKRRDKLEDTIDRVTRLEEKYDAIDKNTAAILRILRHEKETENKRQ